MLLGDNNAHGAQNSNSVPGKWLEPDKHQHKHHESKRHEHPHEDEQKHDGQKGYVIRYDKDPCDRNRNC